MPPKRKKLSEDFVNEDDEAESTNSKTRKASSRAKQKHSATVLAIDVGCSSGLQSVPTEKTKDLERSLQIVDWIISRKLFTDATDQFSLLFFGHESTTDEDYPNLYIHNQEFEKARIEWLHMLQNEVHVNPKSTGDYVSALYTSLEMIKVHAQDLNKGELTDATITLVSNFAGIGDEDQVMEAEDSIARRFNKLGVTLVVIGPDLAEEPKSKAQKIGYNFVRQLATKVESNVYNFIEALSKLQFFIPKPVAPRGQPFNLELGEDFSIRVQMYVKNVEMSLKLSFNPVAVAKQQELMKIRRYETVKEGGNVITLGTIDQTPDTAFNGAQPGSSHIPTGKHVAKHDIIRGYRYGSTLVPFDKDVQNIADFPREGKQLQLIHFIRRDMLLPQFLMSNPRYILPHKDAKGYDKTAHNTFAALVQAMTEKNMVALCRYAYNVNSNPRLCCLIPKMTKEENYPVLIHYLMPFHDDFRYYEFPDVLSADPEDIDFQKECLIDAYIDHLMLSAENGKNEQLKKKTVHDPRIQFQCMTLRQKAMNKETVLTAEDKNALLELLSPRKEFMTNARDIIQCAKEAFPLVLNEKTRMAAFAKPKEKAQTSVDADGSSFEPILATLEEGKLEELKLKKEENGL